MKEIMYKQSNFGNWSSLTSGLPMYITGLIY